MSVKYVRGDYIFSPDVNNEFCVSKLEGCRDSLKGTQGIEAECASSGGINQSGRKSITLRLRVPLPTNKMKQITALIRRIPRGRRDPSSECGECDSGSETLVSIRMSNRELFGQHFAVCQSGL